MAKRLLVAWFNFSLNGGIERFISLARIFESWGHTVDFLSLDNRTETPWPQLAGRVLPVEALNGRQWDAVMVPGAGAPTEQLDRLCVLQDPRFGVRVQHILDDPTRYDWFARVNMALRPDVVIFNNTLWQPRDFRKLEAHAFHYVPGAVDTDLHRPDPQKNVPCSPPYWRIGGCGSKNVLPLVQAVEKLPDIYQLHLYGTVPAELEPALYRLHEKGRLVVHGVLLGEESAAFYRDLDLVVTTEIDAGWSDTAAEALASGVPAIVTPAGTKEFACHGENSVVLPEPDPEAISRIIRRITGNKEFMKRLGRNAARSMQAFNYPDYARRILERIERPTFKHYCRAPELGLFGKWEIKTRLNHLDCVLQHARGADVLDLGAAEGVISHCFAVKGGARRIHGFEYEADRVEFSRTLLKGARETESVFRQADLSDWNEFRNSHSDLLIDQYDVVLFLGLYHHLPETTRKGVLKGALDRSRRFFLIRTPRLLVESDALDSFIREQGFTPIREIEESLEEKIGWLGIYQRS